MIYPIFEKVHRCVISEESIELQLSNGDNIYIDFKGEQKCWSDWDFRHLLDSVLYNVTIKSTEPVEITGHGFIQATLIVFDSEDIVLNMHLNGVYRGKPMSGPTLTWKKKNENQTDTH